MKKLKHITQICREIYEEKGPGAVYDYVNDKLEKKTAPPFVGYKECSPCEAETPHWHEECLLCGQSS